MLEPGDVKQAVRAAALAAGADAVRFASAAPDAPARARMAESFARGDLAAWRYDAAYAAAASDPGLLLPGATSVVCVAVAYANQAPEPQPWSGRVSNYAWGEDYHALMRDILGALEAAVRSLAPEARSRAACDTAPLAERAFAARSGLAWIGKHTCAIVPGIGSYAFLGELITTLELEPDPPLRKTCGTCRRCVDVCPTGALRGDYTIDAARCISDLTQRSDWIPRPLRPLIGEWVWGCDLCQEVCPPTRLASQSTNRRFGPRAQQARPDLVALLRLRAGEFKRRFAATPMGWRGAAVLRRNAAVAFGNSLDRAAVEPLAQALATDPHAMVRGHAAWALGRIGSPRALACLGRSLDRETNRLVADEIRIVLEPNGRSRDITGM